MLWVAKDGSSDPSQKHAAENGQTDLQPTENLTQGNLFSLDVTCHLLRVINLNDPIQCLKWKQRKHLGMQ